MYASKARGDSWQTIGQGETNSDGRVQDLLSEGELLVQEHIECILTQALIFPVNQLRGFIHMLQ